MYIVVACWHQRDPLVTWLTPSIPQNAPPVHIAVVFYAPHKSEKHKYREIQKYKTKRNHKSYRNKINAQYQKYKMLRTTRVLIAVVFSAPPTSPLSQRWSTEMSNPLYLVERAVHKMWYFTTQSYYYPNNIAEYAVVRGESIHEYVRVR